MNGLNMLQLHVLFQATWHFLIKIMRPRLQIFVEVSANERERRNRFGFSPSVKQKIGNVIPVVICFQRNQWECYLWCAPQKFMGSIWIVLIVSFLNFKVCIFFCYISIYITNNFCSRSWIRILFQKNINIRSEKYSGFEKYPHVFVIISKNS